MNISRSSPLIAVKTLFLSTLLASIPVLGLPQDGRVEVPENATSMSYGKGWECIQGYRPDRGACNAVNVPDNAYATGSSYGRGWKCKRGYRQLDEACVAIIVPPNAYLNHTGTGWTCDRGYRLDDNGCVAIEVPANGYLTEANYGPWWTCERGYRAAGTRCVAVQLPANAHLDYSGSGWDCDPPYRNRQNACVPP